VFVSRRKRNPSTHYSAGFSMIEVLISFLVLAAGLLGVASMQKQGFESNHGAYLRSQASSLAQDMSSRMRSNMQAVEAGNYNMPSSTFSLSCLSTGCSSAQMAAHDNFEWQAELAQILPQGVGIICLDSTADDGTDVDDAECDGLGTDLAIKVWWDAMPRDGVLDQRYAIPVRL